jgi:hypothetical protein
MDNVDREFRTAIRETLSALHNRLWSLGIRSDIHPTESDAVAARVYERLVSVLFYANPSETVGEAFSEVDDVWKRYSAGGLTRRECHLAYLDTAIRRLDESLA